MKNIVLSGTDLALHKVLIEMLVEKEWNIASCYDASISEVIQEDTASLRHFAWNPYSAFSTGAGVLAAKKFLRNIDEAVIHISNEHISAPFHKMNWSYIEQTIDRNLKGIFFLVHELAAQIMKQERGGMMLIYRRRPPQEPGVLQEMIDHAIIRMGEVLCDKFSYTGAVFRALRSEETEVKKFSEHIITLLNETPARPMKRWARYSEKSTMFLFRN